MRMTQLRNHRLGLSIQRVSFMDLITMVDHKLRDRGRRIGLISTEYMSGILAMGSLDKMNEREYLCSYVTKNHAITT